MRSGRRTAAPSSARFHSTLSHILFADQSWLHRFTRGRMPAPQAKWIAKSTTAIPDWSELHRQRVAFDEEIIGWAKGLQQADLEGDLTWYSGALGKEVYRPVAPLVVHVFNHQTLTGRTGALPVDRLRPEAGRHRPAVHAGGSGLTDGGGGGGGAAAAGCMTGAAGAKAAGAGP